MRLIDLSQPIFDGCPNCPDHPPVRSEVILTHEQAGWRLEKLTLANHTGSHVDAPLHKLAGGASLDDIPLERWVGKAFIADLRGIKADHPISASDLATHLPANIDDHVILLCTGWGQKRAKSEEWLHHAPQLAPDGAQWLVDHKARGVGIDHYAVGGDRTHEILLGANIWIVEELRFPAEVFEVKQPFEFWCLPINLRAHTGAFCRPVAVVAE
jgi:kynurenine formamidase